MLYFSKLKLFSIYLIIIFLSIFTLSNFINSDNFFVSKKVNLGLDLQGGSYLLLEVDSSPIVKQNLQNKLLTLRKALKDKNIKNKNLKIKNDLLSFEILEEQKELFEEFFLDKKNYNPINIYYAQYKSHELDLNYDSNIVNISYSKYGLVEISSLALDQSLEIVRRRIDEVGTKEPTIIKQGNDRI